MSRTVIASVARIADLDRRPWTTGELSFVHWQTGDYVEAEVTGEPSELYNIEDTSGAMIPVEAGDCVIGALGERAATLEGVGSWRAVSDGRMHCMTNAGLFGQFTSLSVFLARPISLVYRGHLLRDGSRLRMRDFALPPRPEAFAMPTVLVVGTSMSAGKTTTGRLIVGELSKLGLKVIGAKLTGAGRYRDVLSFRNAGASAIYDFVDAGLPSTVVPEADFRAAIRPLLAHIGASDADVLVAEAGASPLEPYNGAAAISELGANVKCTILCASDPYAVLGVQHAFGLLPDLVSGPAANTSAGIDLVRNLCGLTAVNVVDPASRATFRAVLADRLNVPLA